MKTQSLKLFAFLILLLAIIPVSLNGQNPDAWVLHSENQGVKIYYQISGSDEAFDPLDPTGLQKATEGSAPSILLLKLVNNNPFKVKAEWFKELKKENDGSIISLELQALESRTTDNENSPRVLLSVGPDDGLPVSVVESIELLNIEITVL